VAALPDTKEGLEAIGYVFTNDGFCRKCGAQIEWWITNNEKRAPFDVIVVKDTPLGPIKAYKRVSHFASCPFADDFRK